MTNKKDSKIGKPAAETKPYPKLDPQLAKELIGPILKIATIEASKHDDVIQKAIDDLKKEQKAFEYAHLVVAQRDALEVQINEVIHNLDAWVPGIKELRAELRALQLELFGDERYINGALVPRATNTSERAAKFDSIKGMIKAKVDAFTAPLFEKKFELEAEIEAAGLQALVDKAEGETNARRQQVNSQSR